MRLGDLGGGVARRSFGWTACALGALAATAGAQEPVPIEDLDELTLEELLDVEVTTVTHEKIRVGSVPAALHVISRQDIRRSGLTTIPELLRLVPGLSVARIDATRWSIGARGFAGEFTNKLLVLIDGRRVYTPLFAGVHWDVQDLNVEDVERIEVIRGPGGVRWGANAVNGVIHVITRTSTETQGGLVQTTVGSENRAIATVRYGGRLDETTTYRAFARYLERDAQQTAAGDRAADGGDLSRLGARVDGRRIDGELRWMVDAGLYTGRSRSTADLLVPAAPFVSREVVPQPVDGGHLFAEWRPVLVDAHATRLAAWFDANRRDVPGLIGESRQTLAVELSHVLPEGPLGTLTFGGGVRHQRLELTASSRAATDDTRQELDVVDAFVEDRIAFGDLTVLLGAKLEYNDFVGAQLQPNLRVAWQPQPQTTIWGAVSRAVRTPTFVEEDLRLAVLFEDGGGGLRPGQLLPNRDFDAETLICHEFGVRSQLRDDLYVDFAAFFGDYDDLGSYAPTAPADSPVVPPGSIGLRIENGARAEAWGGELAAVWDLDAATSLSGSYSYARVVDELVRPGAIPTPSSIGGAAPRHQAQLHLHRDLGRHWSFDGHVYWVDRLRAFDTDASVRVDLRVSWRPSDDLRLEIIGQNLLDDRHPESRGEFFGTATEVQRSILFTVTHSF